MRSLIVLLFVFLATVAHSGPSTTFLWNDAPPLNGSGDLPLGAGNGLQCFSFIPQLSITAASLSFSVTTAGSSTCQYTMSIYNASGSTLLGTTGPQGANTTGVKQATGLSIPLVAGAKYHKCGCWAGDCTSLNLLGMASQIGSPYYRQIKNTLAVPLIFNAGNPCTSGGIPPSSLGAFSATDAHWSYLLFGTNTP